MVCNTCGKDNPTNRESCWNCGGALDAGISVPPSSVRSKSVPCKAVIFYGSLYIVGAAILLTIAIVDATNGGTPGPIVALTAFCQAVLFGVTGWSILTGHRWAVTLVWVATVLGAIGVLFRGIVPLDLLLWLTSLGIAVWYTRKCRLLVLADEANAEMANSVSIQPNAEPELPTQSMDSAATRAPAFESSQVAPGTITENSGAGQGLQPALTPANKVPSPAPGSGAAPGKRTAMRLWLPVGFGTAALIVAGVLLFIPELRTLHQVEARKELGELNYKYDTTSFFQAALRGDTLAVRLFLEAGMNPNEADDTGATPLMGAAYNGHPGTIKLLLDKGADPSLADSEGDTAFLQAATSPKDNVATMKLLLQRGANPYVRLKKDSPLSISFCVGPVIAVVAGTQGSNVNNLNYLLEMGADVNSPAFDITGTSTTPLGCAVSANNVAAVKLLLDHDAQVRASDLFYAWNANVWTLLRDAAQKDPTFWDRYKDYPPDVLYSLRDAMKSYRETRIVGFLSHYRSARRGKSK